MTHQHYQLDRERHPEFKMPFLRYWKVSRHNPWRTLAEEQAEVEEKNPSVEVVTVAGHATAISPSGVLQFSEIRVVPEGDPVMFVTRQFNQWIECEEIVIDTPAGAKPN